MVLLLRVKLLQYCVESESRFQRWRLWDFTNPGALPQARGDWCAFGAKHLPQQGERRTYVNFQNDKASNRAMRLAAFLEVMLMILFSAPERWSGFDVRHNWAIEPAALLQFFFRSVGGGLLLRGMIKNYRSILRPNIRALPVQRSRVMVRPENIQQFVIADL
jgi:hypothetical protein